MVKLALAPSNRQGFPLGAEPSLHSEPGPLQAQHILSLDLSGVQELGQEHHQTVFGE